MAKMQRWRPGRSSTERTLVEETPDPGPEDAPESAPETAADITAEEPDDADEAPEVSADEADDDELAAEPVEESEPAEDEPVDDEDELERPVLPAEPVRTGLGGWLLGGRTPADVVPLQLLQAAHAKQAVTTALAMGLVAAVAGRPAREAGIVLLTVLVGQTILGWHNDIVDRQRDQAHGLTGKPIAAGRLEVGTAWYAIVVAFLLLVPLATMTGAWAAMYYAASLAVAMLGNIVLRTGVLSWWSWAASYALLPAYLSYGGWGGQAVGEAPEPAIVALAALLGVGIHFMRAVWGLVADHEDGWTYLPLKLGLKLGATRLLALSTLFTVAVVVAMIVVGARVGLSR
ncbi:hypothetical protein FHP29_20735 [Nocardioides albidus]|uniref:4-hydroxybenzoate polyprenyltransferase n=1 Tax=Nocardioides albidus TaxID=1517589 RepID=A0A5C4VL40_9ACTN|nr:UbiA family prenyltransferase [Nocardioides albidus]TNM36558.1 hypothetical protein FHP29_20735 [Nocardioides albidus]